MIHELKTDPDYFDAIARGEKTFEYRQNDRNFLVGDTLMLRRTKYSGAQMNRNSHPLVYTGERMLVKITYILDSPAPGLPPGWVVMSIRGPVAYAAPTNNREAFLAGASAGMQEIMAAKEREVTA